MPLIFTAVALAVEAGPAAIPFHPFFATVVIALVPLTRSFVVRRAPERVLALQLGLRSEFKVVLRAALKVGQKLLLLLLEAVKLPAVDQRLVLNK